MPKSLSLRLTLFGWGVGIRMWTNTENNFLIWRHGSERPSCILSLPLSKGPVNNHKLVILKELWHCLLLTFLNFSVAPDTLDHTFLEWFHLIQGINYHPWDTKFSISNSDHSPPSFRLKLETASWEFTLDVLWHFKWNTSQTQLLVILLWYPLAWFVAAVRNRKTS